MKNKVRNLLVGLGIAGFAFAPAAMAGLLTVTVGAFTCHDGDACDLAPAANVVSVSTADFNLTAAQSFSNNPGGATGGLLDLSWQLNTLNGNGGTLVITAFQDGFTHPGTGLANLTSTISGDMENGTLTAQQFLVDDNGTHSPGPQGPFSGPLIGDVKTLLLLLAGTYSLEEQLSFDLAPEASTTGDFKSRVTVPEPATLALLGLALVGLGFTRRKA